MNLNDIAVLLDCPCEEPLELSGMTMDSRQVLPGYLFIAYRGERFDGHDFAAEAQQRGAVALLVERKLPELKLPQLQVADIVQALAAIATAHRQKQDCQVIALTGSNGKTSVKEMIAAILPQNASYATQGNLNNHLGVPLCVLQLEAKHRYAVFELGANHCGEIAHTVAIVKPDVALINNIAPAHIGEFGSIDNVAKAKGEIYQGLAVGATAVVNDDDAYAHFWDASFHQKNVLRFSSHQPAMIYAQDIHYTANGCARFTLVFPKGRVDIELHVPGAHNISNAIAAASCTYAVGISLEQIQAGLQSFRGVSGRLTFLQAKNHAVVIDDSYNANLRSSLAALEVLSKRPGRRIFVFGDMGELGPWSDAHHHDVGRAAQVAGIEVLMTFGKHSALASEAFGQNARHYLDRQALVTDLLSQMNEQTTVLIKGSRSSRMEEIVQQLF